MAKLYSYTCSREGFARLYYKDELIRHKAYCAWCTEKRRHKKVCCHPTETSLAIYELADPPLTGMTRIDTENQDTYPAHMRRPDNETPLAESINPD